MIPRSFHAVPLVLALLALMQCATPPARTPMLSALSALQARADSGRDLPRPRLPADADTNSAVAYYRFGTRVTATVDTAELALYWASKLDPGWAEPLFARSLNLLSALRNDAFETWYKTRSARAVRNVLPSERQVRVVDSLQRLAWHHNPFIYSELEFRGIAPGRPGDPVHQRWIAFAARQFSAAESLFAMGLRKHPDDIGIRVYRARALFYLGKFDAAVTELEAARDTVRRITEAKVTPLLPSVEMFDFAIGIARVQQDDFPAARAAFERALASNLGFYWAHTRLAGSALALNDTATALTELDLALQLEGGDPVLHYFDGFVLLKAGRFADAETHLRRAVELDPYYAAPYYWLAVGKAARGDTTAAITYYRDFLARAARDEPFRPLVLRSLAALGVSVKDST